MRHNGAAECVNRCASRSRRDVGETFRMPLSRNAYRPEVSPSRELEQICEAGALIGQSLHSSAWWPRAVHCLAGLRYGPLHHRRGASGVECGAQPCDMTSRFVRQHRTAECITQQSATQQRPTDPAVQSALRPSAGFIEVPVPQSDTPDRVSPCTTVRPLIESVQVSESLAPDRVGPSV